MKEKTMNAILAWLGIVAIICWVLIPIRVYILHANDWRVGLLSILGLVFIGTYFIINWKFNSETAQHERSASSERLKQT